MKTKDIVFELIHYRRMLEKQGVQVNADVFDSAISALVGSKVTDMTRGFEHALRRAYGDMTKNDLIKHCIDLQCEIEHLEYRIACHDASNILHDVAKEIEAETDGDK